jgi:hypothetical protein
VPAKAIPVEEVITKPPQDNSKRTSSATRISKSTTERQQLDALKAASMYNVTETPDAGLITAIT